MCACIPIIFSHPVMSRLRQSYLITFSTWQPKIRSHAKSGPTTETIYSNERLDIQKFSFRHSFSKFPCKRVSNQNWFFGHDNASLACFVFRRAIWSKITRVTSTFWGASKVSAAENLLFQAYCSREQENKKASCTTSTWILEFANLIVVDDNFIGLGFLITVSTKYIFFREIFTMRLTAKALRYNTSFQFRSGSIPLFKGHMRWNHKIDKNNNAPITSSQFLR